MKQTHPPALLTLVARSLRGECAALRGKRVLVAMSGGVDSQVLLHALAWHRKTFDLDLVAHGVDHGLRPEAAGELDLAAALAESLGVPFGRSAVVVAAGANVQARARDARFASLAQAAASCAATFLATAHHADDRAETLLIRLLRGAGPRGLAVLPAIEGDRARPLLRATRAAIVAHAERHGLAFARDPSNDDPRFVRVRIRRELVPLLRTLDPRVVEHVNRLADSLGALRAAGALAGTDEARDPDETLPGDQEFVTNDE